MRTYLEVFVKELPRAFEQGERIVSPVHDDCFTRVIAERDQVALQRDGPERGRDVADGHERWVSGFTASDGEDLDAPLPAMRACQNDAEKLYRAGTGLPICMAVASTASESGSVFTTKPEKIAPFGHQSATLRGCVSFCAAEGSPTSQQDIIDQMPLETVAM